MSASQGIGFMIGAAFSDMIIDNIVSVDDYVLFSTTKVSWEGKTRVIGVGAFGNVFVTGKLDEALGGN